MSLASELRLEAQKDFFEAKRAADHLEGSAEAALQGELLPPMLPGHSYWRNPWVPAGVSVIISPMNFIWGIPGIHLVGAYLAGVPFIYKGHPYAGITNTTMIRMMIAAGADPAYVQKVEGFGKGISKLATDRRVTVVAVTGSSETASIPPRESRIAVVASSQRAGLPIRIALATVSGLSTRSPSTSGAAPAAWNPYIRGDDPASVKPFQ